MPKTNVEQQSLETIATLIEEYDENGSPVIERANLIDAVKEVLFDAGYLEEDEDSDDDDDS